MNEEKDQNTKGTTKIKGRVWSEWWRKDTLWRDQVKDVGPCHKIKVLLRMEVYRSGLYVGRIIITLKLENSVEQNVYMTLKQLWFTEFNINKYSNMGIWKL